MEGGTLAFGAKAPPRDGGRYKLLYRAAAPPWTEPL